MPETRNLQEVAEEMAEAIREWNRAKAERESWKPVVGHMPPVDMLGSAKKANAMLSKALEDYERFQRAHTSVQESFQEAIAADPDMSAEQKEYWLLRTGEDLAEYKNLYAQTAKELNTANYKLLQIKDILGA